MCLSCNHESARSLRGPHRGGRRACSAPFLPRCAQAIKRFGHTLLVLQPWNNPLPLTRSWCLWEILCTIRAKSTLEVALGAAQEAAFLAALRDRFDDIMARWRR